MARSTSQSGFIIRNETLAALAASLRTAWRGLTAAPLAGLPAALRQDAGEDDLRPISRSFSQRRHEAEERAIMEMLNRHV